MIVKYSQQELISMVSEKTGYQEQNIAEIFVGLEESINDLLLRADKNKDVEVHLIPGIRLFSFFVPAHDKVMPDGTLHKTKDSLKFSARFTDNFTRTRRRAYEQTQEMWERIQRRKRK